MAKAKAAKRRPTSGVTSAHAHGLSFAEDETERGWRAALRRPGEPEAGMRVAYSYVVALLAATIGIPVAIASADWLYGASKICVDDQGLACPVLWLGALVMGAVGILLALGAWFFRLGWAWWLAGAALALLLVEVVVDPLSPWMLLALVIPGLAAVASDPALPRRAWRTWGIVALAVLAGGYLLVSVWPS